MKTIYQIGDKKFVLKPYNTRKEKEILWIQADDKPDDEKLSDILELCGINPSGLSLDEKLALVYKLRTLSLGDDITLKYACSQCHLHTDGVGNIGEIVVNPTKTDKRFKNPNRIWNPKEAILWFSDEVLDEDLDTFDELCKIAPEYGTQFNYEIEVKCLMCGKKRKVNLRDPKLCIDLLSDTTIKSLYEQYLFLTIYSHNTIKDVDKMLPFERKFYSQMLDKHLKDTHKAPPKTQSEMLL